jgi:phosphohistidine swiveling domain-containing protein
MARSDIIRAGGNPLAYSKEEVGGKGLYLLKLHQIAQKNKKFNVPDFFIVPTNLDKHYLNNNLGTQIVYTSYEVEKGFRELKKPIGVRSSSPLEDGVKASFAGMFNSIYDNHTYEDAMRAAYFVYDSAFKDRVENYAKRMGVPFSDEMALIFQEQVTDSFAKGIIQLEEDKAVVECIVEQKKIDSYEIHYDPLDEESNDISTTGDYYAIQCAREAKKLLGLEGLVQVEFFLSSEKLPSFVQIRQLPKPKSHAEQLDLSIPKGAPYIESEICNDVAGDITLPAYVTTSKGGFRKILIETGHGFLLGIGDFEEEKIKEFRKESNLAKNIDFQNFTDLITNERMIGSLGMRPAYAKHWEKGNSLFEDYVLVCNKLDESLVDMADVTTNKRAIITCNEALKTSHAMTVARDLGIMCMGVKGNLHRFDPEFFHKVETGDVVRMKSDGKRAVAYIEKKRTSDPYDN